MGVLSTVFAVFTLLTRLRIRLTTSKTKIVKENKFKLLSSKFKRVDTIFVANSSSVTVSFFGFGLVVIPISTGFLCGLTVTKNVIF